MNKIRVLPDNLANQIAAGEVVERPASVIKELVENAIDAGRARAADRHRARRPASHAGDRQWRRHDRAMMRCSHLSDMRLQRSKTLDDLAAIGTLGFRGEAARFDRFGREGRADDKDGRGRHRDKVIVEGGRLVDVKDAARDTGTTIAVRDLFFNTPARRKFMRSEATENYHLTSIVTHYALAHPEVAFTLTNNGRDVLRVSPAQGPARNVHSRSSAEESSRA